VTPTANAQRRARHALWTCLTIAVVLTGVLNATVHAGPGPGTSLAVAALGIVLTGVLALATRLLLALTGRLPPRGRNDELPGQ